MTERTKGEVIAEMREQIVSNNRRARDYAYEAVTGPEESREAAEACVMSCDTREFIWEQALKMVEGITP